MQQLPRGRQCISVDYALLYLEDFIAILQLFREHCDVVKVTADGFVLDDAEREIPQLTDQINRSHVFDLDIDGSNYWPIESLSQSAQEYIRSLRSSGTASDVQKAENLARQISYGTGASLSLNHTSGSIIYDADDPKAKALAAWVLERLTYRNLRKFVDSHFWLIVAGTFAFTYATIFALRHWPAAVYTVAASLVIWYFAVLPSLYFRRVLLVLILEKRSQRPSFFARNKDQLVLIVITSLVTALPTLGITLFVQSRQSSFSTSPSAAEPRK